jgi:hypothetical protein
LAPVSAQRCANAGFVVGIDVIGGHRTETHVTSPTGIRAISRLGGPDVAGHDRSQTGRKAMFFGRYAPDTFSRRPSGRLIPGLILLASFQKRAQPEGPVQSDNQAK